jgi:TfoX/Sxy family transcriptional regulator of competence genes
MAFDIEVDDQIKEILKNEKVEIKKMFGGTCYIYENKMICGVWKDNAIFKVNSEIAEKAVSDGEVEYFNMQKKIMKGMIMINKNKLTKEVLGKWIKTSMHSK